MESNFKGTKGKWEKVVDDKNFILVRAGQIYKERPNFYSMKIIVGCIHDDDCGSPKCCRTEEHANAILISKAPEMLEMLQSVLELQISNYGDATSTHLDLIGKAKEIKNLIKEATEL